MNKVLIGGRALVALGSARNTLDIDYLVDDKSTSEMFIRKNGEDYCNANGSKFFKEIYDIEKDRQIASAQSLLELKAYGWVQHSLNGNWKKVTDYEYDIKFLVQNHNVRKLDIVQKYLSKSEFEEVTKFINNIKI
ncbi:MAG: hypothetical protein GX280_08855 [Lentisphaerae bacterium]|jgi:hypothetical protein|nr:hypothetical protein [Lentisphaerota bacterium]